jgi:hypothetical protein
MVVSLPAIAEHDEGSRKEGEALWPSRFPLDALARTREAIGSAAWMAMYQQRPVAEEGKSRAGSPFAGELRQTALS